MPLNTYAGSAGTVGACWPHLAQVGRVERRRRVRHHGRWHDEAQVTFAPTSLPPGRAASALLAHLRRLWGVEDKVHWVRDVTFDGDGPQVRCGATPQVTAAYRNLGLALLRRAGATNIAEALRTNAGRPHQTGALILSRGSK